MNAAANAGNAGYNGGFPIRIIKRNQMGEGGAPPADPAIAAAQSDAEKILAAARAEAEILKKTAQEQAETQARLDVARQLPELQVILMEEIGRMRSTLAHIVRAACEKIIGERYNSDEALERCIEASIKENIGKTSIALHVAPSDWTTAERAVHQAGQGARTLEIKVLQDPMLEPGVCKMETGGVTIEIGLKPLLDLLENLLARVEAAKGPSAAEPR